MVAFYDVNGAEECVENGTSMVNLKEARFAGKYLRYLYKGGLLASDIAVLWAFRAQVLGDTRPDGPTFDPPAIFIECSNTS